MFDLAKLQQDFAASLMSSENDQAVLSSIKTVGPLSDSTRLAIYRESMQALFIETLTETYPVCDKLVGREFFTAMCFRYLAVCRSDSPDLNDFGANFPAFTADFEPLQSLVYYADVAQLEWDWHCISLSPIHSEVHAKLLQDIPTDDLPSFVFCLPQGARLFESNYPCHRIWQINTSEDVTDMIQPNVSVNQTDELVTQPSEIEIVDLDSGGVQCLLYRSVDGPQMIFLQPAQAFLLHQVKARKNFALMAMAFEKKFPLLDFSETFKTCYLNHWLAI